MGGYNLKELANELCFKSVIVELYDDSNRILSVTRMSEILSYNDTPDTLVLYDRNGSEITFYKNNLDVGIDEDKNYVLVSTTPNIRYVISE